MKSIHLYKQGISFLGYTLLNRVMLSQTAFFEGFAWVESTIGPKGHCPISSNW